MDGWIDDDGSWITYRGAIEKEHHNACPLHPYMSTAELNVKCVSLDTANNEHLFRNLSLNDTIGPLNQHGVIHKYEFH